jgi:retron-type reverse transcriptase
MLTAQAYLELVRKRGEKRLELKRVYHNLRRRDLLMLAYSNLQSNRGRLTPGTNPTDTMDGMSKEKIDGLSQRLGEGRFRWQPVRRVYICF